MLKKQIKDIEVDESNNLIAVVHKNANCYNIDTAQLTKAGTQKTLQNWCAGQYEIDDASMFIDENSDVIVFNAVLNQSLLIFSIVPTLGNMNDSYEINK